MEDVKEQPVEGIVVPDAEKQAEAPAPSVAVGDASKVEPSPLESAPKQEGEPAPEQKAEPEVDPIQEFFKENSIDGIDGLKGILEDAKSYKQKAEELEGKIASLNDELTLRDSDVKPERYEDVKIWFRGSGLKMSKDKLLKAIETHPEWKREVLPTGSLHKTQGSTPASDDADLARAAGLPGFIDRR